MWRRLPDARSHGAQSRAQQPRISAPANASSTRADCTVTEFECRQAACSSTSAAPLEWATANTRGCGDASASAELEHPRSLSAVAMRRAAVLLFPVPGGPQTRERRRHSAHAIACSCDSFGRRYPRAASHATHLSPRRWRGMLPAPDDLLQRAACCNRRSRPRRNEEEASQPPHASPRRQWPSASPLRRRRPAASAAATPAEP